MTRKILFIIVAIIAILVGFYPGIYFLVDRKFGLLQTKTDLLLSDVYWNIGFYTHIIISGIALLTGWTQFINKLRIKNVSAHRVIGKIYVICALIGSIAGIFIAFHATGGIVPSLGFIGLGIAWFYTTMKAYLFVRKGLYVEHRKWMYFSYAVCFAAVTLRIYLPILQSITGEFNTAYSISAWLCWIPNLFFASILTKRIQLVEIQLS